MSFPYGGGGAKSNDAPLAIFRTWVLRLSLFLNLGEELGLMKSFTLMWTAFLLKVCFVRAYELAFETFEWIDGPDLVFLV
jgi:hypothetical protein